MQSKKDIQIISAPSILGLRPTGVEKLAENFLQAGLAAKISSNLPVRHVPTLNKLYNPKRDPRTKCLNPNAIRDFSSALADEVSKTVGKNRFALVLGGDCSILIGISLALKAKANYGLVFLDAHADFYEPEKSISGEVADMDLAIVTGRGPETLTNINNLKPYIKDENVVHIGQRDREEAQEYGSQDIRKTAIKCFDLAEIQEKDISITANEVMQHIDKMHVEGVWIHFDTDVLSDKINPAVDYRLPDGLQLQKVEQLIRQLLNTLNIVGMSVTIFNPKLDPTGQISEKLVEGLERIFIPGVSLA